MTEVPIASRGVTSDDSYPDLLIAIRRHFATVTTGARVHLFTTDAPPLYSLFLDGLPPELRQAYRCSACRRFLERFGAVVRIDDDGKTTSVLWPAQVPEPFGAAIAALSSSVTRASVTGVFLAAEKDWGTSPAGGWDHFSVAAPESCRCMPSALDRPSRLAATAREEHAMLLRGLAEFPLELVRNAHSLLSSDSLFRSEKCIGVARWLRDLHEQRLAARNVRVREALTWLAVARAPPGFCHIRTTMIGGLLADLAAELPFAQVKARFDAKMHPLQYQRPTAAPSAGNIAQAEKVIATLRAAGSLERRFARLTDLKPVWTARSTSRDQAAEKGVFSHLKPKGKGKASAPVESPAVTMTWEKLARTVLPTAVRIEFLVPASQQPYLGMVTAQNPEAPPIVQWDFEDERNPVTYYVYNGGSLPEQWNLTPAVYHPVTAVVLHPSTWGSRQPAGHQGQHAVFILEDCRDTGYSKGAGFFPEFLKSEFHGIRATIEAYAKKAVISGTGGDSACGICLFKGSTWNLTFRVLAADGMRTSYKLDRWD